MNEIIPTLGEMRDSCQGNADRAERLVRQVRDELLAVGEPSAHREGLKVRLSNAKAEHAHWSDYLSYYRQRCAAEGERTRPAMGPVTTVKKFVQQQRPHWSDVDEMRAVANAPEEVSDESIPF